VAILDRFRRVSVDVQLPIGMQPQHRTAWYEEPLVAELQAQEPHTRGQGGGTMLDENRFIENCDLEITLPRRRRRDAVQLVADALSRIGVPLGTTVRRGGLEMIVGTDTVLTVRLPLLATSVVNDDTRAAAHGVVDSLRAALDEALSVHGEVRSWQITPAGTQIVIVSRQRQPARDIAADLIASHRLGRGARAMEGPPHDPPMERWGTPLSPVGPPNIEWRGPAVYYVRCDDGTLYAGSSRNLRRRIESVGIFLRHQDRPIVATMARTEGVGTHAERRTELQRMINTLNAKGDFKIGEFET
jgi:hypothetical protein